MADEQIDAIQSWLDNIKDSLDNENISYGELAELEAVASTIAVKGE